MITADPAVKQVFTGDPNLLTPARATSVLAPILGPRSVLLLDGAEHLRQRRLLLPPFHGERMAGLRRDDARGRRARGRALAARQPFAGPAARCRRSPSR